MRWWTVLRGVAMLVALTLLLDGAAVASAAGRWTAVNFPARETADDYAVSCVSATSCYLAGAEGNSAFMRFDGRRLHSLPTPPFGPQINSDLEDLSCASTRFCMAVGDRRGVPASADRWNGSRWTATPVPIHLPAGPQHTKRALAGLISVACPSSSMCLAVGGWFAFDAHGLAGQGQFAVRWDGTRWSALKVPVRHAVLLSVACASTADCTLLGARVGPHTDTVARPISLRWRHGHWSPLAFSTPRGVTRIDPTSISCPALGRCVAVGSARRATVTAGKHRRLERALVLRQRGRTWIARTLPPSRSVSRLVKGPSVQSLTAVSCPPGFAVGCVAVGTWGTAAHAPAPSAGTLWASLAPGHRSVSTTDHPVSALSCPTVQFCLGAGNESVARLQHHGFSGSFFGD